MEGNNVVDVGSEQLEFELERVVLNPLALADLPVMLISSSDPGGKWEVPEESGGSDTALRSFVVLFGLLLTNHSTSSL